MSDALQAGDTAKAGVTLFTPFLGLHISHDPGVMLGAFAGSLIFIISAADLPRWARIASFAASLLIGVIAAEFTASLLSFVLEKMFNAPVVTPVAVGATLTSVAAVRVLMFLSVKPQKTASLFDKLRKREEK